MSEPEHKTIYYLVKKCNQCYQYRTSDNFYKNSRAWDGLQYKCKDCMREFQNKWRTENKEEQNRKKREWRHNNPDKVAAERKRNYDKDPEKHRERSRRFREENPELVKERAKQHRDNNKEKRKKELKDWRERNEEHIKEYNKKYRQENRDQIRKYKNEYEKHRRRTDENFQCSEIMRRILRRTLACQDEEKMGRTCEILGYSPEQLNQKLEFQFKDGMGWHNRHLWHVDHKVPLQRFLDKGEKRPEVINALSNLQPMWASENCSKQDKL